MDRKMVNFIKEICQTAQGAEILLFLHLQPILILPPFFVTANILHICLKVY